MSDFTTWRSLVDGEEIGVIPDAEDFEHNDLSGVYDGDLDQFDIQTNTVIEGDFTLEGANPESHNVMTRTTEDAFERLGLRIDYQQQVSSDVNGGLALMENKTGISNNNGYVFQCRTDNDTLTLTEIVDGSIDSIETTSHTFTEDQPFSCSIELPDNGDLIFNADEASVTVTNDTRFTELNLAWHTFRGSWFADDVQFSSL